MPVRVLLHGRAASSDGVELAPGAFARDVATRGQMLLHIEFLSRYAGESAYCVCTREPPHLPQVAELFPWVHFLAFGAPHEYDPERPALDSALDSPITAQTVGNITRYTAAYTCEAARGLAAIEYAGSLVMICHGEDPAHQLCLHVHTRAAYSLLELSAMPCDYIEGELILPIYIDPSKSLLLLVAHGAVKGRRYDPSLLSQELGAPAMARAPRPVALTPRPPPAGFFQTVQRASEAYDIQAQDLIVASYAQRFAPLHGFSTIIAEYKARMALDAACTPAVAS